MFKRLKLKEQDLQTAEFFSKEFELNPIIANILSSRDIKTKEEVIEFVNGSDEIESPFALFDMDKAVERLTEAVELEQKICVYGDYDADGVCSTAILYLYLRDIGANVCYYLPERSEGYGLNQKAIERLGKQGIELIVTVDNGIVANDEVLYAGSLGMDVIITDHHQPRGLLPEAFAVVNPHRPEDQSKNKYLCGAGVALQLISAMEGGDFAMIFENYGEIAAIATIGDVVPLLGDNRTIVRKGLQQLAMTASVGLHELLVGTKLLNEEISSTDVAFRIVPRINAAGRMGKASIAVQLLITEDPEEAGRLFAELETYNIERKALTDQIQNAISYELLTEPKRQYDSIMVLAHEGWSHGVIGISASKLVDQTGKATFLFEIEGNEAKGSGRGIASISLADLLVQCDDLLIRYGGHKGAAGLTIATDKLDDFRKRLNTVLSSQCQSMPVAEIEADLEVTLSEITLEVVKSLQILQPFGEKNPEIQFLLRGISILEIQAIGGGKHTKIRVKQGSQIADILCFGIRKSDFSYTPGQEVNMVVSVSINEYQGKESVSYKLSYMEPMTLNENQYFRTRFLFERLMRGETLKEEEILEIVPNREDLANLYRFLKKNRVYNLGEDQLSVQFDSNYGKIQLALMIFEELQFLEKKKEGSSCVYQIKEHPKKMDLASSRLLKRLDELSGGRVLHGT